MESYAVFPCDFEIRQRGAGRILSGTFNYSTGPGRGMGTVADRGRVRKERIGKNAFGWQITRFQELQEELGHVMQGAVDQARRELIMQELERRNVHVLAGHSFQKPLGDMLKGTARVTSDDAAVRFEVDLPDEADMPSYMLDTIKEIRTKRAGGISPGFKIPPANVVPNALTREPEPGNPGVFVEVVNQAVLHELSIVTRPVYAGTEIDVRAEDFGLPEPKRKRVLIWL